MTAAQEFGYADTAPVLSKLSTPLLPTILQKSMNHKVEKAAQAWYEVRYLQCLMTLTVTGPTHSLPSLTVNHSVFMAPPVPEPSVTWNRATALMVLDRKPASSYTSPGFN